MELLIVRRPSSNMRELEEITEPNSEGEFEENTKPIPNAVGVFEKVMGPRRGYSRGLGLKPSVAASLSVAGQREEEQTQQPPAQLARIFSDLDFLARLSQHMVSATLNQESKRGNQDDMVVIYVL